MPNNWEVYAPTIIIVVVFLTAYKIFVTPAQLNDKIEKLESKFIDRFASKDVVNALKEDIQEVKKKVNDIYDLLLSKQ